MPAFINEFVSDFGSVSLALLVGVLALVVWGLAHVSAKPDTTVSILWRLVVYTKSSTLGKTGYAVRSKNNVRTQKSPQNGVSQSKEASKDYEAGQNLDLLCEGSSPKFDTSRSIIRVFGAFGPVISST
jgi:hypothetical protein